MLMLRKGEVTQRLISCYEKKIGRSFLFFPNVREVVAPKKKGSCKNLIPLNEVSNNLCLVCDKLRPRP